MLNTQEMDIILNDERLAVLRDLALTTEPGSTIYEPLTRLASKVLGSPISLMSMVAADFQFFKAACGMPDDLVQTPFSHSFCKHVVATNEPLIVADAVNHPVVKNNLAIRDLDVHAYLGMPMTLSDGRRLGSFCAIDTVPREWTQVEIEIMYELTQIVMVEIDLAALALKDTHYAPKHEMAQQRLRDLADSLDTTTSKEDFLQQVRTAREHYLM
jgi:GAF domain-containing protein